MELQELREGVDLLEEGLPRKRHVEGCQWRAHQAHGTPQLASMLLKSEQPFAKLEKLILF